MSPIYARTSRGKALSTSRMSTTRAFSSALGHLVVAPLSFCISWQHLLVNEPKNLSCSSPSSWSSHFLTWALPSASAVQYVSYAARAPILAERGGMAAVAARVLAGRQGRVAVVVAVVEEEEESAVDDREWESDEKEEFVQVKR